MTKDAVRLERVDGFGDDIGVNLIDGVFVVLSSHHSISKKRFDVVDAF